MTPKVVVDGRCSKVNSLGTSQYRVLKLYISGTYVIPGGPTITITSTDSGKKFNWAISDGWVVNDVTAAGSLVPFDHFDYDANGGPRDLDTGLHAPLLANQLRKLSFGYFCYSPVEVEEPLFSISGAKYNDANGDGSAAGDSGIEGWTIELYKADLFVTSTVTDYTGYSFGNLLAGTYKVCEVAQGGWTQTYPDGCHTINLTADATGVNFLNTQAQTIECGETLPVSDPEFPDASATFTRTFAGDCGDTKVVESSVYSSEGGTVIEFVPNGSGDGTAVYTGELFFQKNSDSENPLGLTYDPDNDDSSAFVPMPDCDMSEGPSLPNDEDTWCVVDADAEYQSGTWTIHWSIYGEGDPRFR